MNQPIVTANSKPYRVVLINKKNTVLNTEEVIMKGLNQEEYEKQFNAEHIKILEANEPVQFKFKNDNVFLVTCALVPDESDIPEGQEEIDFDSLKVVN